MHGVGIKSIIELDDRPKSVAGLEKAMMLTPLDEEGIFEELRSAHVKLYGTEPHTNLMAGVWSHIALENGKGRKIWNYNFGNIGLRPSDGPGEYYDHFGKTRYRSFENFQDGAAAYWRFLESCPMALKNFRYANPSGAAISLRRCNYYRADEEHYSKLLSSLYATGSRIAKSRKSPR
jgi:hypothetical protein